jgi:hypothetical protein
MANPFIEDLNDTFQGVQVRVETANHTYEGYGGRWDYDDHAFLIHDAERDDGEHVGAVFANPETVERLDPATPIEDVPIASIVPSPYSTRHTDDADHQQFIKRIRERGHLLTYPTVRPVADADHDYEVVAGHRRFDAAQNAGLDTIAVRVADLDGWEAVERFVDDHIPLEDGNERYMYTQQEINATITRLREEWSIEKLRELEPLRPYLKKALASTRQEGIRQGYVTDGQR